ncbi:MAG: stage III sporulation protein AF [Suilimivivens sp.]
MIEIIKEAGIFIVVAQAVLYLVPGEIYEKYVKVIIGIVMVAKLIQPVLTLFSDEVTEDSFEKILEQSENLFDVAMQETEESESWISKTTILKGTEEELKKRLNEKPLEGYLVEEVLISQEEEDEISSIIITVSKAGTDKNSEIEIEKITVDEKTETSNEMEKEEEALKKYYGQVLFMEPQQIEIRMNR